MLQLNKLNIMTKKQELDAWKDFAEALPIQSYSKGALCYLLIELENALRSDYIPTLSLFEAGQRASNLIEGVKNTAEGIIEHAKRKAESMIEEQAKEASRFRARVDAWKIKAGKEIDAL